MAFLADGNDRFDVPGGMSLPALLYGGDGDDRLGAGGGRSVLIGGQGRDNLIGGADEDILIGGSTAQDDPRALQAILAEWSTNTPHENRPTTLAGLFEAVDDQEPDNLTGAAGRDWYFAGLGDSLIGVVNRGPMADTVSEPE